MGRTHRSFFGIKTNEVISQLLLSYVDAMKPALKSMAVNTLTHFESTITDTRPIYTVMREFEL